MTTFDLRRFVDDVRVCTGLRAWSPTQLDGLAWLVTKLLSDSRVPDPRWMAYILATIQHECAGTWRPIEERAPRRSDGTSDRRYFDRYEVGTALGRVLGNDARGDGYRYRGRGYCQITGKRNYARLGVAIGRPDHRPLVDYPSDALVRDVAYDLIVVGMTQGLFTGRRLGQFIVGIRADYCNARRIVNGLDQAILIESYAVQLHEAITAATRREAV